MFQGLKLLQRRFYSSKKFTIGIREEQKGKWERRSPLSPEAVQKLSEHCKVVVQPSKKRIFTDTEFERAGAILQSDLSEADMILGIKEVPVDKLIHDKHFLFFSHTHKGQKHNLGLLQAILNKKIKLSDYELLVNDKKERLVAFGKFAGVAGMIDILHGIGLKLLSQGLNTPFVNVGRAYSYFSTEDAKNAVRIVGQRIASNGLPKELAPVIFLFTGKGNVSQGAQEIFSQLPHEFISVSDMKTQWKSLSHNKVYGVIAEPQDYLRRKDGGEFDFNHYLQHGSAQYDSVFHDQIIPWVSCLINGAYWDEKYPRLLTNDQYAKLAKDTRMIAIADISCDIKGPLEFMDRASTIDEPFFTYDPVKRTYGSKAEDEGVLILSIDNLPAELPLDASNHFSEKLYPLLSDLVVKGQSNVIENATIAANGSLLDRHQHLSKLLVHASSGAKRKVLLLGSGRVAAPLVDYFLKKSKTVELTIASNSEEEAKSLSRGKAKTAILEVENSAAVGDLVGDHDITISFLPAFLHHLVAEQCIKHKKNMVTASYVSPKISELGDSAKESGITILNELGLDPGIDHLLAMKFMDQIRDKKGKIKSFVSWCGGLPAPEYSNNPLGYKFSWSPRGVLSAAMNPAKFKLNGKIQLIEPGRILDHAQTVHLFKGFSFEGLANRDSLKYINIYNLDEQELETMFRGTLRYSGFAEVMVALRDIGLLNDDKEFFQKVKHPYWDDLMSALVGPKSASRVMNKLVHVKPDDEPEIAEALSWLGLFSHIPVKTPKNSETLLDALCKQLELKLAYQKHERDMVCLHHTFEVELQGERVITYQQDLTHYLAKTCIFPCFLRKS